MSATHSTKGKRFHQAIFGSVKLLFAACTIVAIGAVFLTMNPSPEEPVKKAEADIFELGMGPGDKQDLFVESLKELGMEKPRPYDWNGNKFYFSMKQTKQPPLEVMREFQEKFAEKGVNSKPHLQSIPPLAQFGTMTEFKNLPLDKQRDKAKVLEKNMEWMDDFFNGGVVPIEANEDYMSMSGSTPKLDSANALDYLMKKSRAKLSLEDSVKAMRFIDATRDPRSGLTTVTATWSDRELDIKKLSNRSDTAHLSVDADIPSCMGCERMMRFAGEGNESGYKDNIFAGHVSPDQMISFYDRALKARGWDESPTARVLEGISKKGIGEIETGAIVRHYSMGPRFLTVMAYREQHSSRSIVDRKSVV